MSAGAGDLITAVILALFFVFYVSYKKLSSSVALKGEWVVQCSGTKSDDIYVFTITTSDAYFLYKMFVSRSMDKTMRFFDSASKDYRGSHFSDREANILNHKVVRHEVQQVDLICDYESHKNPPIDLVSILDFLSIVIGYKMEFVHGLSKSENKPVLRCVKCNGYMRAPIKKIIKVVCPHCRANFHLHPAQDYEDKITAALKQLHGKYVPKEVISGGGSICWSGVLVWIWPFLLNLYGVVYAQSFSLVFWGFAILFVITAKGLVLNLMGCR